MAIVDGYGRAYAYRWWDEADGTDSSFCTAYYSSLNNSTGCIAPGTAVRLTDPGQIIQVNSMDDIRFEARETTSEMRAHAKVLRRAQAAMQQQAARSIWEPHPQQVELRRAMGLYEGESMPPYAEELQREVVRRMEMGVPQRSPVSQAEQRLRAERQQAMSQKLWRTYGSQLIPQHPEYHPQDQPVPSPPTYSDDYLAQEKKREEAEERAQELLGYMIGEKQIEVYKRTDNLFVKGKKYSYIIQKGGYILQLKKNKVIQLCVHLEKRYAMPPTDNVIAMKLRIENEEKKVLQLANEWGEDDRETYALPECAGMV